MRWLLLLAVAAGGVRAGFGTRLYWLEPSAPYSSRGDELVLHLWSGDRPEGGGGKGAAKRPISSTSISSATARDGATCWPRAKTGRFPWRGCARTKRERAGDHGPGGRGPITMEAERFNKYLADEGAEAVIAQRAQQGQTDQPGHEIYSRFLKSLVQSRDPAAAHAEHAL